MTPTCPAGRPGGPKKARSPGLGRLLGPSGRASDRPLPGNPDSLFGEDKLHQTRSVQTSRGPSSPKIRDPEELPPTFGKRGWRSRHRPEPPRLRPAPDTIGELDRSKPSPSPSGDDPGSPEEGGDERASPGSLPDLQPHGRGSGSRTPPPVGDQAGPTQAQAPRPDPAAIAVGGVLHQEPAARGGPAQDADDLPQEQLAPHLGRVVRAVPHVQRREGDDPEARPAGAAHSAAGFCSV
jgi:hypothetical protein